MTESPQPLLTCFDLQPQPQRRTALDALQRDGTAWIHLDRNAPATERWLAERLKLPPLAVEALMDQETRPRVAVYPPGKKGVPGGTLLILRGVNLNPGADPEDMVSIRLWVEERRVVSVVIRRLRAVTDLEALLDSGHGPQAPGALVAELADLLTENAAPVVTGMDERLDELEIGVEGGHDETVRGELLELRHRALALRRFVAPQRDALQRLAAMPPDWLADADRMKLQETADEVTRLVEHLNFVWERAAMLQEQALARSSERTNQRLYMLAIVAGLFLPLSFVTGLLGINVAGLPGTESPYAFLLVCLLLVVFGLAEYWLFRRLKWL
jgi:zinc transporter